jgi:hypothetical protein
MTERPRFGFIAYTTPPTVSFGTTKRKKSGTPPFGGVPLFLEVDQYPGF